MFSRCVRRGEGRGGIDGGWEGGGREGGGRDRGGEGEGGIDRGRKEGRLLGWSTLSFSDLGLGTGVGVGGGGFNITLACTHVVVRDCTSFCLQAKFMPYTGDTVLVTAARDGQVGCSDNIAIPARTHVHWVDLL